MTLRIRLFAPAALLIALALPMSLASARNYDCSKAGNANKTACKSAPIPAGKSAPKTAPAKVVAAKPAPVTTTRNYDCSKAGNANKTACKSAATPVTAPKSTPMKPAPAATTRNYDCSKAGNANKTVCKGQVAAPAPRVAAPAPTATHNQATNVAGPQGASAKCRDNTYSHSKTHTGACSHHGGVAQWY